MSIESQVDEMTKIAERDGFKIKEIKRESHSAKSSGSRPVFVELLQDLRKGKFNAILTWAPDRLSRNAGDLGSVVDLMDQGKLKRIQTYSQSFSNSPNEKFLLMILCSQAKLENDNKGVNVQRGLRNKCGLGWRPSIAPIGYLNVHGDPYKDDLIIADPERSQFIKKIFERSANQGQSGRTIKQWLDRIGFTTRKGKSMPLSKIYEVLNNPFYYGQFEFPVGSGTWYTGKHQPLIDKPLFDKAQEVLKVPPRGEYDSHAFPFKTIFTCGGCGGGVTAEEKYRKLKRGGYTKHVYYHCGRSKNYSCSQAYITEIDLIRQLLTKVDVIKLNMTGISRKINEDIDRYHRLKTQVLKQEYLDGRLAELQEMPVDADKQAMAKNYLTHILTLGTAEEREEVLLFIKTRFTLKDREIFIKKS